MDRGKVIKEFEHILNEPRGDYLDFADVTVEFGDEILTLLKEQGPVKPEWNNGKAFCGKCGKPFPRNRGELRRFCSYCGQEVKWND